MKKIDLGQMITILANVGVITGIVFLGVQIRDEQEQAKVSNTTQAVTEIAAWMRSVSGDPEQADLFQKGAKSFSGLSESEQFRFDLLIRSLILQVGVVAAARERGFSVAGAEGDTRIIEGPSCGC